VLQSTADFDRSQSHLSVATLAMIRRFWARMGPDFDAAWLRIETPIFRALSTAQLSAATTGAVYAPAALQEQGVVPALTGTFNPSRLAGIAADGRSLEGLLYGSVTRAKEAIAAGSDVREALQFGGAFLDAAVDTAVQDAGRVAAGVQMAQARGCAGYIREEKSGCCKHCALLMGKFYRWSTGFERHLHCHGKNVPVGSAEAGRAMATSPRTHFDGLSAVDQDRIYGKAAAQAIRDGADISQVVNANRGMRVSGRTTTEGTTRRGSASKYLDGRQRLMPEEIYRLAGGNREAAVKLLYANGYLT
jgi:hypothetical protein